MQLRRTSLVVQWLRICLPMQGMQVRSLVRELRSPMLWQLSLSETISLRAALKTQCSKKKNKTKNNYKVLEVGLSLLGLNKPFR